MLILYGAGNNCQEILELLTDLDVDVCKIWDRDAKSIKERYGHIITEVTDGLNKSDAVIVITILNGNIANEAKRMLTDMGYKNVFIKDDFELAFRYAMLKKYFGYLL